MEKIRIDYGIQGNGMVFELHLRDYEEIKRSYQDAQPAKSIFVQYDMRTNFAEYHPQLEKYVYPALVGFAKDEDFKKVKTIEFLYKNKVTYTIENNYEQKAEPLSR